MTVSTAIARPVQRILFVDDDPTVRRSAARTLRRAGFIVDLAETAEQALHLATAYEYALVATDLQMYAMDGVDLVQQIREKRPDVACVLVTGRSANEVIDRLGDAEIFDDIVRKPWIPEQLVAALREVLHTLSRRRRHLLPVSGGSSSRRTVLLVEDGALNRRRFSKELEKAGAGSYVLRTCDSMMAALDAIKHQQFLLLISALQLKDSTGLDTVRTLKGAAPNTPLIVLADSDDDALGRRALSLGAHDYLLKGEISGRQIERSVRYVLERNKVEAQQQYLTRYDGLTGLANRALFQERLAQAIAQSASRRTPTAVMYIDLDHFKSINDARGREKGDAILRQVAIRLLDSVADTNTVARLDGDEFALVIGDLSTHAEATPVAERIMSSFATPFDVAGEEVEIGASVSIVFAPDSGDTTEVLLRHASSAMRSAKARRGCYVFYDDKLHLEAMKRVALEADLRVAVLDGQFELLYQPRVRVSDGTVVGAEALLRWNHPGGKVLLPEDFMRGFESTNLIEPLAEWMLSTACSQFREWLEAGLVRGPIAVKLPGRGLLTPSFVEFARGVLDGSGLAPERLEIAIDESVLVEAFSSTTSVIEQLSALKVRIALDDFGAGLSSLRSVAQLPLSALRVPEAFVAQMESNPRQLALIDATIKVGKSLGFESLAQGVETDTQLQLLRGLDCEAARGSVIAAPMPARDVSGWLKRAA